MAKYRAALPQLGDGVFLYHAGMETDLIFNHGVDLPGFSSYPLLESDQGRETLRDYYAGQVDLARSTGTGILLESATWKANRDRAVELGRSPAQLETINAAAIELLAGVREQRGDLPTVLSATVGPRGDAYAPSSRMSADEAENYHAEQIAVLSRTEADMVSALTLCYAEEAIGIVCAARQYGMPVAISFTVETDGRLPTGMALKDAIETVDDATGRGAAYYLVNCAHPDHFSGVLKDEPWMRRLKGVVVNASRCSHAELDEAEELDDGNPQELGRQVGALRAKFPHFTVVGGCCGTDLRHLQEIAENTAVAVA